MIIGQKRLEDGAIKSTKVPNLFVLLAGSQTPSPAELLSSKVMGALVERCTELFDMVVIDSAPLFPVVDSLGTPTNSRRFSAPRSFVF